MVVVVASQYSMLEGQGQIALCQMAAVIFTKTDADANSRFFTSMSIYLE